MNQLRAKEDAVIVRIEGAKPDREAKGASVEMLAGGRTWVGSCRRGGSILAASDVALHFGLGRAESIDLLRVRWPDGSISNFLADDLPIDSVLTIRQGEPRPSAERFANPGGRPR